MADDSRAAKKGAETSTSDAPAKRISRHVQPLGPRVLVRVQQIPSRLESGLYVPDRAKDAHVEALLGEVVEVARTQPFTPDFEDDSDDELGEIEIDTGLGENVSGVPLGAKVLFAKDQGIAVPWDETLRIVDVRWILAIVEEIPEEKMQ